MASKPDLDYMQTSMGDRQLMVYTGTLDTADLKLTENLRFYLLVPEGKTVESFLYGARTENLTPFISRVQDAMQLSEGVDLETLDATLDSVVVSNSKLGVVGVDLFAQLRMVQGIARVLEIMKPRTLDELPLAAEMVDKYGIGVELNGQQRVYVPLHSGN